VGLISKPHYHDEIELLVVYEGELGITVNGENYYASAGEVVYVASGMPHSTFADKSGVIYGLLQFRDGDFIDPENRKIIKYSMKLHLLSEAPIRILKSDPIKNEFDAIIEELSEKQRAFETMIRSSMLRIIAILNREGALSFNEEAYLSSTGQKLLPALAYINENYREDISLTEISAKLGFNESYFCRIFKQAIGATFTEYLNFVRVCKAEKLLAKGHDSILNISESVGFSSVSYFNRIFKKYRNCSPRVYRTVVCCNM
jgi:AraC-like DNA-binding protein